MTLCQPLDPEIATAIDGVTFSVGADTLAALRAPRPMPPLSGAVTVAAVTIPGEPDVQVRVHRAGDAAGPLPCLVSIHGGGMVMGSALMDDPKFDAWCPQLGLVGVSVDYRLAPETPYPGPLDDCYAALRWVADHADELGVDPARIGVGGISAGAGLAAGVALLARDRGEIPLAFQLLETPMLDDRQITPSSRLDDLAIWSRQANRFGWSSYLGELYGTDAVPAYAAPARATDLAGLPPAFVSVGTCDGFRDEAIDYALRLNQADVPCELHVYPGAPHGFQMAADAALVRRARRDLDGWLARQAGSAPTPA